MSTGIEWTDATWNPITGCSKVSPGCAHCYAEMVALRFWPSQYPPVEYDTYSVDACCPIAEMRAREFMDVQCHEDRLEQPLRWRKPRKVFVNSMSDLFHEDVPDAFIDRVFAVMALAPQHTFQVLTKRAERMRAYVTGLSERLGELWDLTNQPTWITLPAGRSFPRYPENWPLSNVWLGVSVENQHFADERIPLLLDTPAAVRFVSAEPLLAAVDLYAFLDTPERNECLGILGGHQGVPGLDWVIVGGESGAGARPFNVAWARSIVGQCKTAGVPCFVKQLGSFPVVHPHDAYRDTSLWAPHVGLDCSRVAAADTAGGHRPYRPTLKSNKGGDPAEWPEDLRVRQMPAARL